MFSLCYEGVKHILQTIFAQWLQFKSLALVWISCFHCASLCGFLSFPPLSCSSWCLWWTSWCRVKSSLITRKSPCSSTWWNTLWGSQDLLFHLQGQRKWRNTQVKLEIQKKKKKGNEVEHLWTTKCTIHLHFLSLKLSLHVYKLLFGA